MKTKELPSAGGKENFLAEAEVVDLSDLKDKVFGIAVATGDPEGVKFLCSTIHGPYNFSEMLQEVGGMWVNHQHHSKCIILSKNTKERPQMLDPNTIDYIECNYVDLITEEMLGGAFDKEYTCRAGMVFEEESTDPRHAKKEDSVTKQNPSP
jgi:hypothetical protein